MPRSVRARARVAQVHPRRTPAPWCGRRASGASTSIPVGRDRRARLKRMTDAAAPARIKITYATLRNDNDELHRQFDAGLERARALLGGTYRNFVDGKERDGDDT